MLLAAAVHAGSISAAKLLADGEAVTLSGKPVTATFPGYFYIEEPDRSSGIRVNWNGAVTSGRKADVIGTIGTNSDYERVITATSVTTGSAAQVSPISLTNRALGGADFNYSPNTGAGQRGISGATGANNIGLLVRVWGKSGPVDGRRFRLSDGSAVNVTIELPEGVRPPVLGSDVVVTGISSCQSVESETRRVVRVASDADVTVVASPLITIPAGTFYMGKAPNDSLALADEIPQHLVYLDEFGIGKHEVTRGEYKRFMADGGYSKQQYWSEYGWYYKNLYNWTKPFQWTDPRFAKGDNYPVCSVSWYEAEAYCNWAGGRLPTEAEWEMAARGTDQRIYPWGDLWNPERCNNWLDTRFPGQQTSPVGAFSPEGDSPFGCADMAGNVAEWVSDWYSNTYYQTPPPGGWVNPGGPCVGAYKVQRGGSWTNGDYDQRRCRTSARYSISPNLQYAGYGSVGFRIAR